MKWIKYVFGGLASLIVLAVIVLFILGLPADSNRLQTDITIRQSPAVIWPYLYEPEKFKAWVSWVKEVQRPAGEPTVGSEINIVMEDKNNGGAQMKITSTVEAVESNRHLALKVGAAAAFQGTASYTLTDLGNGETRLSLDSWYQFDNPLAKLMTPVILLSAKKKMMGDLEHLRAIVEAVK